ncbi:hypothetical protein JFL43_02895 [Viridibacillus sp. YIM B01967]|uniref:Uncharacterized protein n=1 Tax=Viridibacillus soli TaxID=2798301 RepID=A0ABS1H350_9BACL|nr:hypothetical protein [Viridibacillus soli]MBK3493822.1 hypothetical protein [Viridibacillus soli]
MKNYFSFAVAGSFMTMLFLGITNYITSPNDIWFIYPCFLLLLWPITLYFMFKKLYKQYSIICSFMLISFLLIENYLYSPNHLWFIYAVYPIIWWPILMFLEEKAKSITVALIGSSITIIYYSILNITLSPQYPWAIYPAFLIMWWPLALYHAKKKTSVAFSINASILISIFFITVNVVSSPGTIWAIYPIFLVMWWPLSMYFYVYKKKNIQSY